MTIYINLGILLDLPSMDEKIPARIDPKNLARHMAILAQSGAGKSFFLGRLIEEIVGKTSAKVIVLDKNSDFVRISHVNTDIWEDPKCAPYFIADDTADAFKSFWADQKILSISARNLDTVDYPIRINWGDLNFSDMASFLDLDVRSDYALYNCLESSHTMALDQFPQKHERAYDYQFFRERVERIVQWIVYEEDELTKEFERFPINKVLKNSVFKQDVARFAGLVNRFADYSIWLTEDDIADGKRDIAELLDQELLSVTNEHQLATIDLQSLNSEEEQLLVVSRILTILWNHCRQQQAEQITGANNDKRVPIFLVIDEAQNMIPLVTDMPLLRRISEQIIKIAAEGRKYGLHLIVVTQRPKKVHPSILSECDNLCLLRMTNEADLDFIRNALGFLSEETVRKSIEFKTGDAVLAGKIVDYKTVIIHASPRRTVEGGTNLPDDWTKS